MDRKSSMATKVKSSDKDGPAENPRLTKIPSRLAQISLVSRLAMATPPTSSFFSAVRWFLTLLAAPAPERDGSKADSFPFDDNRDEKQKEGVLKIVSSGVVVSEKAAHREPEAQEADDEEGCEHNLHTSSPEGCSESERNHHSLVLKDSGARIYGWLDWYRSIKFALKGLFKYSHLSSFLDTGASFYAGDEMDSNHHVILDSGASMHATGNLPLLSEFTRAAGDSAAAVYHARDGKDLSIAGAGIIAGDKFHLPHVHYVPGLGTRFTLISVQQLAGCDYLVMFYGGSCYVKNRSNGSLVGRGRMHDDDGFYHLEFLSVPASTIATDGAN